jgi:hypothetical protein
MSSDDEPVVPRIDPAVVARIPSVPEGYLVKGDIVIQLAQNVEHPGTTSVLLEHSDSLSRFEVTGLLQYFHDAIMREMVSATRSAGDDF